MDIDIMAMRGHLIRQEELDDRSSRTEFAVEEFETHFDELFLRVEEGEVLTIVRPDGSKVLMVPAEYIPKK